MDGVAPERPVGRDHDVVVLEVLARPRAPGPGVVEHPQLGREAHRLLPPVEDERLRHHHQRGPGSAASAVVAPGRKGLALLPARFQQGEHLNGLAEPHVVGQTAAEAELPEEMEPSEPLALVPAEPTGKAGRGIAGLDALEPRQLLAGPSKDRIAACLGQRREESVQHAHLAPPEAQVIAGGSAEPGEDPVPPEPLLREHPVGPVPEQHRALAPAERGQELGQPGHRAAELERAV